MGKVKFNLFLYREKIDFMMRNLISKIVIMPYEKIFSCIKAFISKIKEIYASLPNKQKMMCAFLIFIWAFTGCCLDDKNWAWYLPVNVISALCFFTSIKIKKETNEF